MKSQKCQPSINNHCLDSESIITDGGQIIKELDGTVSVWVNDGKELVPYIDLNTKPCCEFLGFIFDIENQKCLWTEPVGCDTCEKKIVINPNGDDGVVFNLNDDINIQEICSLSVSFDYIFKFDCDIFNSGETANTEVQQILDEIEETKDIISNIDCSQLSATCEEYTTIYEEMCYPIEIKSFDPITSYNDFIKGNPEKTQPSLYTSICCLSEDGLNRWKSILGDIKYKLWLESNGCDTSIYAINQATQLFNEGVQLSIKNGTNINPYFNEANIEICDKQLAYVNKINACEEYENCLKTINDLEDKLIDLEDKLGELNEFLCDDPISNLERFKVSLNIEVETETPSIYESIYEELIFNIGEGNLLNYILEKGENTGIKIQNDGHKIPDFTDCDFDGICKTYRDNFIKELYLRQYVPEFGEPQGKLENEELLNLMGGWYDSKWLSFNTMISNQELIQSLSGKKVRFSLKINDCCNDFDILLDNISFLKSCDKTFTTKSIIKKPNFELKRVIDNKKSWAVNDEYHQRDFIFKNRDTSYNIKHHKLAINTKEIDLKIDPSKAIENDVFEYILNNECLLDPHTGTTEDITHNYDIDFNSILLSQIPSDFDSCELNTVWSIKVSIENKLIYDEEFFTGVTETPTPDKNVYLQGLINMLDNLGYLYTINGDDIIFINVDTPFKLDLGLDLITCEYKQFEDGICFTFEDGEPYIFEDNE